MKYKVKFKHERDWSVPLEFQGSPTVRSVRENWEAMLEVGEPELLPTGGRTTCSIINEDGQVAARGVAKCHPEDNFDKKTGRELSFFRALDQVLSDQDILTFTLCGSELQVDVH